MHIRTITLTHKLSRTKENQKKKLLWKSHHIRWFWNSRHKLLFCFQYLLFFTSLFPDIPLIYTFNTILPLLSFPFVIANDTDDDDIDSNQMKWIFENEIKRTQKQKKREFDLVDANFTAFLFIFDLVAVVVVVVVLVVVVRADDQKYGNKATAITALEIQKKIFICMYRQNWQCTRSSSSLWFLCVRVQMWAVRECVLLKPICCIKSTELDDGVGAFGSRLKCFV